MDRNSQIDPSKRTIYNLDSLAISQRSPSPLRSPSPIPAPLDLSCHNRHGSSKTTEYEQERVYNYSSTGIPESNYSHGFQESVIPTPQQLQYSQYPLESAHHGLYPYDQEFAYRISSTCSPPTTTSDLYSIQDYHQYRVKSPISPNPYEANQYNVRSPISPISPNPYEANHQYRLKSPTSPSPYEANSMTYSDLHYRLPQSPYSPTHDNIHEKSWHIPDVYTSSGMTYQPLTVSTSHIPHPGHETYVSPQGYCEPISPRGLVSPTGSQHSSYGAYGGPLSPSHTSHQAVGAPGCESRHSSSDSSISTEPSLTAIPEGLARYPKGKARRQKIYHKNLSEEEIIQRKREINNDSSRRHRQRKSLSMKQLEEEEQRELARQVHLTKTRDMLKQQTELLGSLINKVDINRK